MNLSVAFRVTTVGKEPARVPPSFFLAEHCPALCTGGNLINDTRPDLDRRPGGLGLLATYARLTRVQSTEFETPKLSRLSSLPLIHRVPRFLSDVQQPTRPCLCLDNNPELSRRSYADPRGSTLSVRTEFLRSLKIEIREIRFLVERKSRRKLQEILESPDVLVSLEFLYFCSKQSKVEIGDDLKI